MIQRIQSIYLFLSSIAFGVFSFLEPSSLRTFDGIEADVSAILSIVAAVLALGVIFLFKNRKLQLMLVKIGMALGLLAIIPLFFFFVWSVTLVSIPFYLLPVGVVGLILANRSINKDEKLVKSLDRLR